MKNYFRLTILFLVVLSIAGCASFKRLPELPALSHAASNGSSWEAGYTEASGLNYIITYPEGYSDKGEPWPLIVFLHSMEERGTDIDLLFNNENGEGAGLAGIALETSGFPFVTVSPLCPDNTGWSLITERIMLLVRELIETKAVDPDRIYITGVSMGGMGTWSFAMDYPDVPAAIAPISGGVYPPFMKNDVEALKDIPVLAFHDRGDPGIPLKDEIGTIEALEKAGGDVEYMITDKGKHYIHEEIYRDGELLRWFLKHTRKE